jgi:hypothetical protein
MTYEIHFIVFSLKESLLLYKKSLKISKRYSKSVNRRTDNTMAKKKIGQKDKQPSIIFFKYFIRIYRCMGKYIFITMHQ